jgi:hypothetical protein
MLLESVGSFYKKIWDYYILITFDECVEYEMLKMALHEIAHEEKAINNQYIEPFYMQEPNPLGSAPDLSSMP